MTADLANLERVQVQARCIKCGATWTAEALVGPFLSRAIAPNICAGCEDKRLLIERTVHQQQKEARAATIAAEREQAWERLCPKEYRLTSEADGVTVLARLELECKKLPRILEWKYQARGLVLKSVASGQRKTRAMWRLIRRLFVEGRTIAHYTAGAFQRRAQDEAGRYTIDPWFNTLARVDVVFLDDLGKGYWTENTEALWFDLVEHRTRDGRPVLVTTNYSSGELIKGSRSEATTYTIRRLHEFCETISMD